jgi:carboxyl-terminal processing protease
MSSVPFRVAAAFVLGIALSPLPLRAQVTAYEQLQAFSGVLSQVRTNYVDSVDFARLVRASIRGLLSSLDPHSHYVTREEFELQLQWDRGELAAPGMELDEAGRALTVLDVEPGGPAARAGVQAGDRVLRINDSSVAGLGARAVEVRLYGEKGTKVRMTFERGSLMEPDTFAVTLKRTLLKHRVVGTPRMADRSTGYVRLAEFTEPATKELSETVKQLQKMGAAQLILDLRGNPGGDIPAMVEIASAFLPANTEVFHTQGRKKLGLESVVTHAAGEFAKLPLMILIDAGSASAAEMLAGSLQDHDRALIVGRRSFGKALIQSSLPLPTGDIVWLTTARVVTPSGRVIQRRYSGMATEQYYALAGRSGAPEDTLTLYRTDHGRPVRGGGGIEPDVGLPAGADLPVWFSVAADSGFDMAVADSVAQSLPAGAAGQAAWMSDSVAWDADVVTPFLARVRDRLGVHAQPAPAVRSRLGRILGSRVAAIRWGPAAGEEFLMENDGDIQAAVPLFARLPELLSGSAATR